MIFFCCCLAFNACRVQHNISGTWELAQRQLGMIDDKPQFVDVSKGDWFYFKWKFNKDSTIDFFRYRDGKMRMDTEISHYSLNHDTLAITAKNGTISTALIQHITADELQIFDPVYKQIYVYRKTD